MRRKSGRDPSATFCPISISLAPKFGNVVFLALAFAAACCSSECAALEADFYVSPQGSDTWSGSLPAPNSNLTDGPFASLARARDAVRESRKNREKDVLVLIRDGRYQLNQTVVFSLEDSGTAGSTVTYAAYPGETPIFSSGKKITGWRKPTSPPPGLTNEAPEHVLVADVDDSFCALFDSDGLLPRARSERFIPLSGGTRNEIHFPPEQFHPWPNVEDIEVVVRPHHAWIVNILPLESIDEQRRVGRTSVSATYAMNRLHFLKDTESCWIENTLFELDSPGEWVLNKAEGKLYLWPRNTSAVFAPQLTELIRIEGEIDVAAPQDIPVQNLCFKGLTFIHGDRYQLSNADAGLQHDWELHDKDNALIRLRGTENCRVEQCRFAHSGSGAIRIDLHGQNNTVSDNLIENMGGTGVLLCGYGPGKKDVNRNNLIQNNHIHHCGRIYSHSPGIMVWQSGSNRVANNLIHHTPYTGIIISGCMADFFRRNGRELSRTIRHNELDLLPRNPTRNDVLGYLHTNDNVIEYNEIHHAMELLGDGNGIYIRGAGSGNIIRHNYIHHLVAPMQMQAAIRTDGGQTDTHIFGNLIYRCATQGIILKLNNKCENNIVAEILAPPRGYYLSLREGPMTGATIQRNIFYSKSEPCTFIDELPPGRRNNTEDRRGRLLAKSHQAATDFNIYYCVENNELGTAMLANQKRDGVDIHSLAEDPLFVDPENGDFRLAPDSPALRLGFEQTDWSKVGLEKTSHQYANQ
ncbi:right-handed parallel beta-helix repeat-containing protein [Thalassoglobus neptunius]|nr:right-handed parallel beta-helix repeat-containing protein [Thalassoglobus neptunius]